MHYIIYTLLVAIAPIAYSQACVESTCSNKDVKQGDVIIPDSYSINNYAVARAVSIDTGKIIAKVNGTSNYRQYNVNNVAVTSGCMEGMCVGDSVIPDEYDHNYAVIKGLNRYSHKYTIAAKGSSRYYRFKKNEISTTQGCLDGICVGDKVFPDSFSHNYAIVVAINPYTRDIVSRAKGSSRYNRCKSNEMTLLEEGENYTNEQRDR
jgi:hypothetical protein